MKINKFLKSLLSIIFVMLLFFAFPVCGHAQNGCYGEDHRGENGYHVDRNDKCLVLETTDNLSRRWQREGALSYREFYGWGSSDSYAVNKNYGSEYYYDCGKYDIAGIDLNRVRVNFDRVGGKDELVRMINSTHAIEDMPGLTIGYDTDFLPIYSFCRCEADQNLARNCLNYIGYYCEYEQAYVIIGVRHQTRCSGFGVDDVNQWGQSGWDTGWIHWSGGDSNYWHNHCGGHANNYSIYFYGNGGNVKAPNLTLTYHSSNYWNISNYVPTRTGYTFNGWYTAANGGTQVYNSKGYCTNEGRYWSSNTNVYAGNYNVYAHWTAIDVQYKLIHRYPNIGGGYTETVENLKAKTDSYVTPPVKSKAGFTSPATQRVQIKGDGSTVVVYNYTRNNYTLSVGLQNSSGLTYNDYGSFDLYVNGKLVANDSLGFSISVPYDSTYEIKDIKAKIGHTYDGVSGTYTAESGNVRKTATLKLNYHINTYTLHFEMVGGVGGPEDVILRYDQTYRLSVEPTRTGYFFKSWNSSEDGTGKVYMGESDVKSLTPVDRGSYTLYAQWTQRSVSLRKTANSWHGGTFVKRTSGDEEWYNTVGKIKIDESIPNEYIIQEWVIKKGETVKRVI